MDVFRLKDLDTKEMAPGYHAKIIHSQHMTFVYWDIKADHVLPEHSHPHEQVVNLIDGIFELTIDEKTEILEPKSVVVIPPNAVHTGKSRKDCKIIDVFYPIREDYRND